LKAGTTQVVLAGETYELGGDIIVQAGGSPVASLNRLRDIVATKRPGDKLPVVIYRGNARKSLAVKLGRQPATRSG
jgi:S1-C subfamily serine protease